MENIISECRGGRDAHPVKDMFLGPRSRFHFDPGKRTLEFPFYDPTTLMKSYEGGLEMILNILKPDRKYLEMIINLHIFKHLHFFWPTNCF